jgi:predicted RNA-binding Zn ribbon-like protein
MDPLWARLLNSDWHDYRGSGRREDRLGNDVWLAGFLGVAGWSGADLPDVAGRERLRRLRAVLQTGVDTLLAGQPLSDETTVEVNRALAAAPLVRRLHGGDRSWSLEAVAVGDAVDLVLAEIAGSFATMLAKGDPTRIKICANPDCLWVIYDESRNRTRRWCDARECGNLIKVRSFRQRRKEARG